MKRAVCAIALSLALAPPAAAHHGKDFLLVESAELPHPGNVYFVSSEMFANRTFTTEPSLLFGLTERIAGEVHVHIERFPGESLHYEAIAPAVHLQFGSRGPWSFAAAAEYEIARHSSDNSFSARLIASRSIGEGLLVVNAGGGHGFEYAIGYRPELEAHTSWGVEAHGGVERDDGHQAIVGIYTQPNERLTFKAGAGAALGKGKPKAVFRTGIVWRF